MPTTIKSGGTNRTIRGVTVRSGGTNRTLRAIYVRSGGVNRLVFAALNLQGLDPSASAVSPGPATATYSLTNAGAETATGVASGTWLTAGVAADYDVMLTVNSGTLTTGTVGSWLNLGTTRTWTLQRGGIVGITTANTTVQIRSTTTLTVLATATVIFTAETA